MSFARKWGPFFCLLAALFLCMADLTRHLVNDAWGTACSSLDRDAHPDSVIGVQEKPGAPWAPLAGKFEKYCYSRDVASEYTSTGALSAWGWGFTIFCTWSGFVLLFVGICWAVELPRKVAAKWRAIRGGGPARARTVAASNGREQLMEPAA